MEAADEVDTPVPECEIKGVEGLSVDARGLVREWHAAAVLPPVPMVSALPLCVIMLG